MNDLSLTLVAELHTPGFDATCLGIFGQSRHHKPTLHCLCSQTLMMTLLVLNSSKLEPFSPFEVLHLMVRVPDIVITVTRVPMVAKTVLECTSQHPCSPCLAKFAIGYSPDSSYYSRFSLSSHGPAKVARTETLSRVLQHTRNPCRFLFWTCPQRVFQKACEERSPVIRTAQSWNNTWPTQTREARERLRSRLQLCFGTGRGDALPRGLGQLWSMTVVTCTLLQT